MPNQAKFTINGTPAEDPVTGDHGYNGVVDETLDLTLENTPSPALGVLYEVYDAADEASPLASLGAPQLLFVDSGQAKQTLADPNGTAQLILPASGVHSWIVRCTATMASGPQVWERMVVLRTTTDPSVRKFVPAETAQYRQRGFADDLSSMVALLEIISGGGQVVRGVVRSLTDIAVSAGGTAVGVIDLGLAEGAGLRIFASVTGACTDANVEFAATAFGTPTPQYEIGRDDDDVTLWNPDEDGDWDDRNVWGFHSLVDGKLYYRLSNNGVGAITMSVVVRALGFLNALTEA